MQKGKRRKKNTRAIKRIAELLPDVLDAFGWYGIGVTDEEQPPAAVEVAAVGNEGLGTGVERPPAAEVAERALPPAGVAEPAAIENPPDVTEEEEEEEGEEEQNGDYDPYVDPWDVQGALDEAISTFIREGLVQQFKNPKKPPSLTSIFGVLFGRQSELTKQAEYFEELISGYDDKAHIDDLREAYGILDEIVKEIAPPNARS